MPTLSDFLILDGQALKQALPAGMDSNLVAGNELPLYGGETIWELFGRCPR
jgi:hypothetical protein